MSVALTAKPRSGVEYHPARIGLAADPRRSGSRRGLSRPPAKSTDRLEPVGAEHAFLALDEVVGVVLHRTRAARRPAADITFMARIRPAVFQSALGAEAEAVGHEPLACHTGSCLSPWRSSNWW